MTRNLGDMANPAGPVRLSEGRIFPAHPIAAALFMLLFTGSLWVIEAFDMVSGGALDREGGIVGRDPEHLEGVLFSPLLHAGWAHLEGNSLFFLVLGFLVLAGGVAEFLSVTAMIWLLGGLGTWLLSPDDALTVGASGVIFGWLVFLLTRGFYARSGKQILLAAVLFFFWGGALLGVLPGNPDISWQAHLCGALAGFFAARIVGRAQRRRLAQLRPAGPVIPDPYPGQPYPGYPAQGGYPGSSGHPNQGGYPGQGGHYGPGGGYPSSGS